MFYHDCRKRIVLPPDSFRTSSSLHVMSTRSIGYRSHASHVPDDDSTPPPSSPWDHVLLPPPGIEPAVPASVCAVFPADGDTVSWPRCAKMVFDLNDDDQPQFEAITSLRLCYPNPEDRKALHRISLRIGDMRIGVHKSQWIEESQQSEHETSMLIFPTRMPLLVGYMKSCDIKVEVYTITPIPGLVLMISPAKLKHPWERPMSCYYMVMREFNMGRGNILGLALRIPFKKAPHITHLKLIPYTSPGEVLIDMKWMRPHHQHFPVALNPTHFVAIPPLPWRRQGTQQQQQPPIPGEEVWGRFFISYTCDGDGGHRDSEHDDYWTTLWSSYDIGYTLRPQILYFENGKDLIVID